MRSLTASKRRIFLPVLMAVLLLLTAGLIGPATAMESDNFAINWDVMGGGGEPISSANYAINATIGQGVIGLKSSTNYGLCSGYWCGAAVEYAIYLPLIMRDF